MSPYQYVAVGAEEPESTLEQPQAEKRPGPRHRRGRWSTTCCIVPWLVAGITTLLLALNVTKRPGVAQCMENMSTWSPAMEAVEYQDVQFQNQFDERSIYKGHPTEELEDAWLKLWNFGPINIPMENLSDLNKSSSESWQRTKADQGGGVLGALEVFHQIHCLDLIRQYTYRDSYNYSSLPAFDGSPKQIRHHVDHCIDSLRIFIQCTADVTPYLMRVDPNRPLGIDTDFNTRHMCRNFNKIQQWAKENELDTRDYQKDI